MAIETSAVLPAGASSVASANLLPDPLPEARSASVPIAHVEQDLPDPADEAIPEVPTPWRAFALEEPGYLTLWMTTGSFWGQPVGHPNHVEILAGQAEEEGNAIGNAGPGQEGDEEEGLREPEPEIGMDLPDESDEDWQPGDAPELPDGPALPGDGAVREGGPLNPTLVEQEVGVCVIRGEVSDATTLDPIAGAIVTVLGTGREAETDAQGRFEVGGLPSGDFAVEALKLGYSMGEASASPRPGFPAEVRFSLRLKPTDSNDGEFLMPEEVIVGEYSGDSQGDLFLDLELSPKLASGLTNDDFDKVAVGDAGEAVSKISGVNVVGGKYAVVRGLSGRYITTTINGAAITSADPSQKTIQLDLLPTSMIQNIAVAKTYDVKLPGDFGGGAINIETLSMPTEHFFETKYELSTNSNLDSHFYRHPDRDLGYWGDVNTPVASVLNGRDPSVDVKARGDLLKSAAFKGRLSSARPTESYGLAYGDIFNLTEDLKLGLVASYSHETGDEMLTDVVRNPLPDPNARRGFTEDYWKSYVDWSVFIAGFLELGDRHKLQFNRFQKRVAEDVVTRGTDVVDSRFYSGAPLFNEVPLLDGFGGAPPYGAPAVLLGEFWDTDTIVRDLEFNQLLGQHQIGEEGPTINWGYTDNDSSEDRPNNTTFNTTLLDFADPILSDPESFLSYSANEISRIFGLGLTNPSIDELRDSVDEVPRRFQRFYLATIDNAVEESQNLESDPGLGRVRTLASNPLTGGADNRGDMLSVIQQQEIKETGKEYFVDGSFPLMSGEDNSLDLNIGFRNLSKIRNARATVYDLDTESNIPDDELLTPGGLGEQAANDPEILANNPGLTRITDNTETAQIRNFDGFSDLFGAYLGTDLQWEWLQLSTGVRYELEERSYQLIGRDNNQGDVPAAEPVWLPSIAMQTTTLSDRFTMGAYYSQTVARPTFFEFLPARSIDQSTGFTRSGNPELQDTSIENFDTSFGLKMFERSSFTVSPFFKKLDKPIIAEVDFFDQVITYDNGVSGSLGGVELEAEFAEWENWTLRGNYTYIKSTLESFFDIDGNGPLDPVLVSQKYPGQPEHIVNVLLGYNNEDHGWGANLIYNFTGSNVLFRRRTPDDPFVEVAGFHQLDANLMKTFNFKNMDLTVSFTVKNILDFEIDHTFVGGVQGYEGMIYDEFRPGRSFSIELKAAF